MNYLTNYYKNLSEKLEVQVKNLETQVRMINEALTSYESPSRGNVSSMGDSMYQGSRVPGDYNGDGRVDGADLGIALGNYGQPGFNQNTVLGNWSSPYSTSGPATFRSAGGPQSNRGRVRGVAGQAEGAATSSRFGSPESAGPGLNYPSVGGPAGGPGANYPSVGGPAGGPGANYPSVGGQAGGPGMPTMGVAGPAGMPGSQATPQGDLPPLTDLNGDGIIDGADLALYLNTYNAAPPGLGQGTQPSWASYGRYGMGDSDSTVQGSRGGPTSNFRRRSSR